MAALAALLGLIDFFGDNRIRELSDAWWHAGANITVVLIELYNFYLRYDAPDARAGVLLVMSAVVVCILLFTHQVETDALAAVTHVNGTARIQTVTPATNPNSYDLLTAFKKRTGYGVLCNTSLNFNGRGFVNTISDLAAYAVDHDLDGFAVEGRTYLLKSSRRYQNYLGRPNSLAAKVSRG